VCRARLLRLFGALLTGADLTGANLTQAIFNSVDLTGANLRQTEGLTRAQIAAAIGDHFTAARSSVNKG